MNIEKSVVLPARKGRPNAYLVLNPEALKRGLRNALFGRYEVLGLILGPIMVILGGLGWVASIRFLANNLETDASIWQFIVIQAIAITVMFAGGGYVFGTRGRHVRTLDIAYGSLRRHQVLSDEDPIYQAIMTGELFSRLAQGNVDRLAITWLSLYLIEADAHVMPPKMKEEPHAKRDKHLNIKDDGARQVLELLDALGHRYRVQRKLIELAGTVVPHLERLLNEDLSTAHAAMLKDHDKSFEDIIEDTLNLTTAIETNYTK